MDGTPVVGVILSFANQLYFQDKHVDVRQRHKFCIFQEAKQLLSHFLNFFLLPLHHPHSHKHIHRAENPYFLYPSGRFSVFELHTD